MSTPPTQPPRRHLLRHPLLEIDEAPLALTAPARDPLVALERDLRGALRELGEARCELAEAEREQREHRRGVLLKVLDAVDVLELALRAAGRNTAPSDPLRSARQLLDRVLQDEGVSRAVPEPDELFDPHRHRVSETVAAPGRPDGAIAEVTLAGWRWNGEILRKAAVVVVRGSADALIGTAAAPRGAASGAESSSGAR